MKKYSFFFLVVFLVTGCKSKKTTIHSGMLKTENVVSHKKKKTVKTNKDLPKDSGKFVHFKFNTAQEYIDTFSEIAQIEMMAYGIPASITLAQGLLESDFGRSRLAVKAKNHFGLKCRKDWKGETIRHTDDAPNECFRKFRTVEDSYKNHSRFLQRNRYRFLFSIDNKDYVGWAHGLKKAGYATDPYYAFKLINLIERYSLQVYDMMEYLPDGEIIAYEPKPTLKPKAKPQIRLAAFSSVNGKQLLTRGAHVASL